MAVDLTALMLDLTGLNDKERLALGIQTYQDLYLDVFQKGIRKTHDGTDLYFFRSTAKNHAFHKSVVEKKDEIDPERIERVKWIKEFIEGNVEKSECWSVPEGDIRKRIYCCFNPTYVIWLKPREGGWEFETAYPANTKAIRGYITRRGAWRVCYL